MNIRLLTILVVIFLGINLVLFAFSKGPSFLQFSKKSNQIPVTTSRNKFELPVPADNPAVQSVFLAYNFSGVLTEKQETPNGVRLKINKGNNLPEFLLKKTTNVLLLSSDGKSTVGTSADLKVGQNLTLGMSYFFNTKTWTLRNVYVSLPSPSP